MDIVWVSARTQIMSVSRHFLLQAPQCPCSVRKRFSRDHCCRGRSNPVAGLWGHTLGESWPPEPTSSYASIDFWCQLVARQATEAFWMSVIAMVGWGYPAWLAKCHVWQFLHQLVNGVLHTPYSRVSFWVTLNDLEWLGEIFSDTKHHAISLRQLSFFYLAFSKIVAYSDETDQYLIDGM